MRKRIVGALGVLAVFSLILTTGGTKEAEIQWPDPETVAMAEIQWPDPDSVTVEEF